MKAEDLPQKSGKITLNSHLSQIGEQLKQCEGRGEVLKFQTRKSIIIYAFYVIHMIYATYATYVE